MKHKLPAALGICASISAIQIAFANPVAISLTPLTSIRTGIFDESAAEIVAYDASSQKIFIVNGAEDKIDIADISDPTDVTVLTSLDVSGKGGPNSVAVKNGLVAVAVQGASAKKRGTVKIFKTDGTFVEEVTVGYHPDMVTFTPDGKSILVANEGELEDLEDPGSFDPEGSVSVINLRVKPKKRHPHHHTSPRRKAIEISFRKFNHGYHRNRLDSSIRVGITPGSKVSQDLEPEYITVSPDGCTAWVSLQENNALAIIDLRTNSVSKLVGLGFKNHSQNGNGMDASNKDGAINIQPWPTLGMYQPDTIVSYQAQGETFIITANEGDSRDFEEARVKDVSLDPIAFPDWETLQEQTNLGRIKITTANGDIDGDGDYDRLYTFGARSFSIHNSKGERVFDSGDQFEQVLATSLPENFNSTNDENGSFDDRSDDKGPEPEALTVGTVNGRTYAFIGMERTGGIMIYDVTNPVSPFFVNYQTQRDFSGDPETDSAGDLAPEGMTFIPADQSPNGKALLVVAYEVSGSTTIFEVGPTSQP